jgi:hypothetical protein
MMRLFEMQKMIGVRVRDPGALGEGIVHDFQTPPDQYDQKPKVIVKWDDGNFSSGIPELLEVVPNAELRGATDD